MLAREAVFKGGDAKAKARSEKYQQVFSVQFFPSLMSCGARHTGQSPGCSFASLSHVAAILPDCSRKDQWAWHSRVNSDDSQWSAVLRSALFARARTRVGMRARQIHAIRIESMKSFRKLGFKSYHEYLKSDHWKDFRRRYFACHKRRCSICGKTKRIELHHITYARLGHEQMDNVRPLCHFCHALTHRTVDSGVPLAKAHTEARRQRDRINSRDGQQEQEKVSLPCPWRVARGEGRQDHHGSAAVVTSIHCSP